MQFGLPSHPHPPPPEDLHLAQVSERWDPGSIPANAHSIDKDHPIDKEAGEEGLSNLTKVTQPRNKSGGV